MSLFDDQVFTVGQYIEILNTYFKREVIRVTGEISELKRADSGHVYFSIKDKKDGSVLSCAIWKRVYDLCGVKLEVGMEIILSGHPNVYPARGSLSFIVDTVELVGEGALKKAYDDLKKKLTAAGVFDEEKKRKLPEYIQRIGIITSMKGAVIHDFMNNLGKFGFKVIALDSRVEGQQAVAPLLEAVERMSGEDIEVLVIIRGGGSLESLQAFNNEALVNAVRNFPVPVIAGLGHDQDVPLVALAADCMTSTPTAAAHLVAKSWEEGYAKISKASYVLVRVEEEIKRVYADLDLAMASVLDHTARGLKWAAEQIDYAERSIRISDPARQLKLGWSLVRHNGKLLRSVRNVKEGDELHTQVADGTIRSRAENI